MLSLTVAIVGVRAFGIARPLARYAHRLVSHDLALRSLAGTRAAAVRLPGRPAAGPDRARDRDGDLLARLVGDVDAVQDLYLRGLIPPLVALAERRGVRGRRRRPAAGGGRRARGRADRRRRAGAGAGRRARRLDRRAAGPPCARSSPPTSSSCSRGAPELVVLGADRAAVDRIERLDAELTRLGRRDALAGGLVEGLSVLVAGLTTAGVLAVCVQATGGRPARPGPRRGPHAAGRGRVRGRRAAAAGRAHAARDAGVRRGASCRSATRPPAVRDPAAPAPPSGRRARRPRRRAGCGRRTPTAGGCTASTSPSRPGERVALVGRSGSRQDDARRAAGPLPRPGRRAACSSPAPTLRDARPARRAAADLARRAGRLPVRDVDPRERAPRPPGRRRRGGRGRPCAGPGSGDWVARLPHGLGHARRRGRRGGLRRRAPPARAGPGAARRLPRAGPGRADRARRPPDRDGADRGRPGRPDRTVLLITHREEAPHPRVSGCGGAGSPRRSLARIDPRAGGPSSDRSEGPTDAIQGGRHDTRTDERRSSSTAACSSAARCSCRSAP